MSFRSATVCLWAAALRVGALLGFFPVHWHGGRARAFSLAKSLTTSGSVLLLSITAIFLGKSVIGNGRFAFYMAYMTTEAVINCTHRREVALLLRCLWEYLSVHPPRAARWRAMFLGTAGMIVWCAARLAFWIINCCIEMTSYVVPGITPLVIGGIIRCVVDFCVHMRLLCPLLVLGAAAAELRVECRQRVLEASQRHRPLHSEYWRALRQRQHLIHDMLREFSHANGFLLLLGMAVEFLAVTPTLGAGVTTVDYMKKGDVLVLSTNILFLSLTVAVLSMCQWPAYESQALLRDLPCMHLEHGQETLDLGAQNELQQIARLIDELHDDRVELSGVLRCDRAAVNAMLGTVCMYTVTCVMQQFQ